MNDISASRVLNYLAERRTAGLSIKSSNDYLQAVKQFCKWLIVDRRMAESPVAHLQGLNVRTDRRHDRRALEVEELRLLLDVTSKSVKRFGMTGQERALLYRLAVETGLRAGELRSLNVSSFDLERSTVTVTASCSKRRREDTLPLRKDMVDALRLLLERRMPHVAAFNMPEKTRVVDMLRADLAEANIPYVDACGHYADFHCLRHTMGSLLAASGVHPKVAQSLIAT